MQRCMHRRAGRFTRLATLALALWAAISLSACSDDPSPACTATKGTLCDGAILMTCVNGATSNRDCGKENLGCTFVNAATGSTCVADPCAVVGPLGVCSDGGVTTCSNGMVNRKECASDEACTFVDGNTGYQCVANTNTIAISGEVSYDDKPPLNNGNLGPIQKLPARGITVALIDDASKQTLATVLTSDAGVYVIRIAPTNAMVHVTAIAQSKTLRRPVTVALPNNTVHGFATPNFAGNADIQADLNVSEASGAAQAFNIFDQSVHTMDAIVSDLGNATPTPLRAVWSRGNTNGTFYTGNTIFMLGETADDDGYDDTVILHETGHYVEDNEGRSDSPGGAHDGNLADPRLAWSEGFATYWACAVQNQPIYSDSNSGGGFFDNIDTDVSRASASGGMTQQVTESMVSQILWDLGDTTSKNGADDDQRSDGNHAQVTKIQASYLASASLRNVGTQGVDVVDFLDGWFVKQGLASCSAVRDIVTGKRLFPYDYAGPGGACP